jgi:hypothetical protein
VLEEQLAQASPDLLRELLTTFIDTLMSAEADAMCGAAYGQASPDPVNRSTGATAIGAATSTLAPARWNSRCVGTGLREGGFLEGRSNQNAFRRGIRLDPTPDLVAGAGFEPATSGL